MRLAVGWIEYWNEDSFWGQSEIWRMDAETFLREVNRWLPLKNGDVLLTYGCGTGFLEERLAPLVRHIHAADVSQSFLDVAARRCARFPNVSFYHLDPQNYTDLSFIPQRANVFLGINVIQYFRSVREIESLITSAAERMAPGGKILFAEIPERKNPLKACYDTAVSVCRSIQKGYFKVFMQTARDLRQSGVAYQKACRENRQLFLTRGDLEGLLKRLQRQGRIFTGNFSVHANRLSLLIE